MHDAQHAPGPLSLKSGVLNGNRHRPGGQGSSSPPIKPCPRRAEFAVTLPGGEIVGAQLAGRDPTTDVVLLRVDRGDLQPVLLEATKPPAPWRIRPLLGVKRTSRIRVGD